MLARRGVEQRRVLTGDAPTSETCGFEMGRWGERINVKLTDVGDLVEICVLKLV